MYRKQSGFTLVEIAIVLVIIGLLLGGVLKGQELINSAKVKNFATDFRTIPLFIYGYQDKYKKLPGDDANAVANVSAPAGHKGNGDGVIEGNWDDKVNTSEAVLFWEHVRLANLASGPIDFASATDNTASLPTNAEGGRLGIQGKPPIKNTAGSMKGTYFVCSTGINGKFAKQLDLTIDDGTSNGGSMMAVLSSQSTSDSTAATPNPPAAESTYSDGNSYTVCLGF